MANKPHTGIYKNCLECNKKYYIRAYRIKTNKFCSRTCGAKYARVAIKQPCVTCKKVFEHISSRSNTAKYCSNKCRYIGLKNRGRTEYECRHCHKKFNAPLSTKRKYCSKACVNKASKKIFKPKYTTVRKTMMIRNLIDHCNRCGYKEELRILGIHHIDRNRNNNDISNLEILCPNCHSLDI